MQGKFADFGTTEPKILPGEGTSSGGTSTKMATSVCDGVPTRVSELRVFEVNGVQNCSKD